MATLSSLNRIAQPHTHTDTHTLYHSYTKHAQILYDKGEVEEAKKILIPASLSTLVDENPELSPSLETLFKWSKT